jgi:hypothetical protein
VERSATQAAVREAERVVPVYRKVDVAVVGGGASGIGAALAAARNGASVILVERSAAPGGTGAASFVSEFHSAENFGGIYREIVERLKVEGAVAESVDDHLSAISFDPQLFQFVALDMLLESGVGVLVHTWAVAPIVDGNRLKGVFIENKSGRQALLADVVIDASGDADIAARSGAPMQPHVDPQPMMMIFRMGGISYDRIEEYAREHPWDFRPMWGIPPNDIDGSSVVHVSGWNSFIEKAKIDGLLPDYFGNYFSVYGITPGYRKNGLGMIYATRVLHRDPFDGEDLSQAEIEGRRKIHECLPFFHIVPGFEESYLIDVAPHVGVRDSRRILGDATLTRDDMFAGRTFEDNIILTLLKGPDTQGWRMHPADGSEGSAEHNRSTGFGGDVATRVVVHGVPYGALLPQGIEGLLVAGKTISMDYEAHARCRDQAPCMGFGQAAGTAAALAVRSNVTPREVDGREVRNLLLAQGAMDQRVDVDKVKEQLRARGREVAD